MYVLRWQGLGTDDRYALFLQTGEWVRFRSGDDNNVDSRGILPINKFAIDNKPLAVMLDYFYGASELALLTNSAQPLIDIANYVRGDGELYWSSDWFDDSVPAYVRKNGVWELSTQPTVKEALVAL